MRRLAWSLSIALGLGVGACTVDEPVDEPPPRTDTYTTPKAPPPPAVRGDVARLDTPEGEAAIQLVLDKRTMDAGDQLSVQLVNQGDVPVMTGLRISEERWNGKRWVTINQHSVWPAIGIRLEPGRSTEAQTWPFGGLPKPGRYRLTKSASYDGDPARQQKDKTLVAVATVKVTSQ